MTLAHGWSGHRHRVGLRAGAAGYARGVDLPVMPPVQPMLAKSVKGIPDPTKHGGLSFEPKWDGFRLSLIHI